EVSRLLLTTPDPTLALNQAIQAAVSLTSATDRGTLQLLAEDGETLKTVVTSAPNESLRETITFRPGVGIAGHALLHNQTINVPDVLADARFVYSKYPLRFRSLLVAPLAIKGRLLGTLSLSSTQFGAFSTVHETLAQLIADQISVALDNARLYQELQEANTELENRVARRTLELEATNKELEAFSYSVSHDLRSPLRSIDGFSNKILKDYSQGFDNQAKDYFTRIMNASRKMGILIDDLLKLSRITRSRNENGMVVSRK
ncbi:MAG: GAF domain-containing protein, partial [Bacteroidetes bacterium]|nr:GAF domain-containing protein [Bacteroidota bacterium]